MNLKSNRLLWFDGKTVCLHKSIFLFQHTNTRKSTFLNQLVKRILAKNLLEFFFLLSYLFNLDYKNAKKFLGPKQLGLICTRMNVFDLESTMLHRFNNIINCFNTVYSRCLFIIWRLTKELIQWHDITWHEQCACKRFIEIRFKYL